MEQCPTCLAALEQILPPRQGPIASVAFWRCIVCGWSGDCSDLALSVSQQVRQCLAEDQDRGTSGSSGGGSGRARRKPLAFEPRRRWDDGTISRSRPKCLQPRSKVVRWGPWTLRVTEIEWTTLLHLAGGSYPRGLRRDLCRVLGGEPESAEQVQIGFRRLVLEFLSEAA